MKPVVAIIFWIFSSSLAVSPPQSAPKHQPITMPLACVADDCPLLTGIPQTAGLRSGFVSLKPGATVGWHTTGKNEETLVILSGKGEVQIDGAAAMPVAEKMIAYAPPARRHNVKNTGDSQLEYVYVVAPAAEK
ncbi:MAG: cupin domain-containing protein [Candidatus Acidiferrales bacterium]